MGINRDTLNKTVGRMVGQGLLKEDEDGRLIRVSTGEVTDDSDE